MLRSISIPAGKRATPAVSSAPSRTKKPLYRHLYVQVLAAIALGALFGWLAPHAAAQDWVKALGDGFVKLIKMAIAPIIFCTVVSGVAHIEDARKVGRVGLKALLYFEIVSTFALALGLLVGNFSQVGAGFAGKPDPSAIAKYTALAEKRGGVDFLLDIIPDSAIGAFAKGDILQVLLFSLLFGFALLALGERGRALRVIIDDVGHAMFGVIAIIMKAAPIGAFGAMAYTVAKYGSAALLSLAGLVGLFYLTAGLFVVFVLGAIARAAGFNIFSLIAYLRDELLIVLGTSSSESALPALMEKLQWLGCSKSVVGLVVPTGYSFNLDGTNIYMTLTTLFIARAMGVELDLTHQATILIVAMLTSKGASGVSGAGFITLAATLMAVDPQLAPGMSLVLGVDKFMSECRALTNFIGNGVATIVVAAWEGELDRARLTAGLARKIDPSDVAIGVTTE
ncbi:C4-dicarboxylate transporter DctA [Methylocystis sp.]|uniref:C4-dicarboxylate transporter DctA n=1 Tax=Methylocystis sp. TaxID=1911079 RepID=UPI0011D6A9EF|nr:MAG: C4-dicarboxylate transport [Methylocystaceae bacterium]TXT44263.1 MAG: C4-dicarboxylate transport protein [Methylocystaceae bacterium]